MTKYYQIVIVILLFDWFRLIQNPDSSGISRGSLESRGGEQWAGLRRNARDGSAAVPEVSDRVLPARHRVRSQFAPPGWTKKWQ